MPHGVVRTNQHHTTRGYPRPGAPYPPSRVAAPSADPFANNHTSITNIVPGGIRDNVNDGVQLSHHGAVQATAGPARRTKKSKKPTILRLYGLSDKFKENLTSQQQEKIKNMLDEPEEKDGRRQCLWVDALGTPCGKSCGDYVARDRHVHAVHNHVRVNGKITPLPGVVGGAFCRFCGTYSSRGETNHVKRHEACCDENPNRQEPGTKYVGPNARSKGKGKRA
ncbi:unnamed protein product [Peniophora sp. CBMAI 1063]|nr:unnamed protein product [Peniophora sp. CBMAI 1063]